MNLYTNPDVYKLETLHRRCFLTKKQNFFYRACLKGKRVIVHTSLEATKKDPNSENKN